MKGTPAASGPESQVRSVLSVLAQVGPEGLTQAERVAAVSALEALKGVAAAAQARLTAAAVVDREALGEDSRSVRSDLALARRCSPTLADQHVGVARALVEELPCTMAALTRGEISERRATIVVRETACLSREHRAEVDRRLASVMGSLGDKALAAAARRVGAALRRFLELRDPTCRVPWCDAPALQADHITRAADGGATSGANGAGLCQRHNLVKEAAGWHVRVTSTGLNGAGRDIAGHGIRITTPTGHTYDSTAPPILGHGWTPRWLDDLEPPYDPTDHGHPLDDWVSDDEFWVDARAA